MGNAMSMKESKPFHYLPEETVHCAVRSEERGMSSRGTNFGMAIILLP
jgi:hypothetical protein